MTRSIKPIGPGAPSASILGQEHLCRKCGHHWFPRKPGVPAKCPNCGQPKWWLPRVRGNSPARTLSAPAPVLRRANPEFACWERRVRAMLGDPMPGKGRLLSYAKQLGDVPPPILTSAKSVRYPYVGADPENPDRLICGWCAAARDSWKRGKYNEDDKVGQKQRPNLPAIDGACFLCSLRESAAGKDVEWSSAGTVAFLSFSPPTLSEA